MPIKNPRLFETEYFDVERVEVLRGPQGTLYGRNATGGAVNVIARRPTKEFEGNLELDAGNYSSLKGKATVNIPLGETFAMRFSGYGFKRDGYSENLFTGNDIDDRDQYAARGALRFMPSEATDLTLTVNYYKEDSHRARVTKQMCHRDPWAHTAACRISSRSKPAICAARSAAISASLVRCCWISLTEPWTVCSAASRRFRPR